jgi:hypothetical protein
MSSRAIPPSDFFAEAASKSEEWTYKQHDAAMVQSLVTLCPDEYLEELRQLLRIVSDINVALIQVTAWRAPPTKESNDES